MAKLHSLWISIARRMADIVTYFVPFTRRAFIVKSMQSELTFLRAVVGRHRLQTGEMPPYCEFLWCVQNTLNLDTPALWQQVLPQAAWKFLVGYEGPEPRDTSGFPRWWLDLPTLLPFNFTRPAFNLSAWVIREARQSVAKSMEEESADVSSFAADLVAVAKSVGNLQASAMERARAIDALHNDSVEVFELTHDARQAAAAYAQRKYEIAHGLPAGPVALQAELPEL